MKKISIDSVEKRLKMRMATCSFCGEENKQCVQGSLPTEISYPTYKLKQVMTIPDYEYGAVITDYEYSFFGSHKIVTEQEDRKLIKGEMEYKYIIENEGTEVERDDADICMDCIKQLARLIPNEKTV